jgi:transposase-like protein
MLMKKNTSELPFRTEPECWSVLEQIAREGARHMLQQALENEVQDYLEAHKNLKDEKGKQVVVRNGYHPERSLVTGLGPLQIKQSRVDDRRINDYCDTERFSSTILPRYLRRMPSIDNLIPVLYLKGISTNDFPTALSAILGEGVKGLSAANIVRLKQFWEKDYREWSKRDLREKKYVYFWVDGIYFNVRLDDERSCILVLMV